VIDIPSSSRRWIFSWWTDAFCSANYGLATEKNWRVRGDSGIAAGRNEITPDNELPAAISMETVTSMSRDEAERRLVWQFFGCSKAGTFVEIGANHPTLLSQTWHLEQQGWSGVLVEPNPELCALLHAQRPRSRVFQAAVGAPDQMEEVDLLMGAAHVHSTLAPVLDDPLSGRKIKVQLRTLDSILAEAGLGQIDFLSIDVEGMELQVLQGLSLDRHAPRLILLEDHCRNYRKHFYLRRHGYRLVKRTQFNNWYVPNNSPATVQSLNTPVERRRLFRKMWLNAPFDNLYRKLKKLVRGKSSTG
jgi:FkbM family methyltransferase